MENVLKHIDYITAYVGSYTGSDGDIHYYNIYTYKHESGFMLVFYYVYMYDVNVSKTFAFPEPFSSPPLCISHPALTYEYDRCFCTATNTEFTVTVRDIDNDDNSTNACGIAIGRWK